MYTTEREKSLARLRQADQDAASDIAQQRQRAQGFELLGFNWHQGNIGSMAIGPYTPSYWHRVDSRFAQRPAIVPATIWQPAADAAEAYEAARYAKDEAHATARAETADMPTNTTLRQTEYQRLTWRADKTLDQADQALAAAALKLGTVYRAAMRVAQLVEAAPAQRQAAQAQLDAQLRQIDGVIQQAQLALAELVNG